MPDRPADASSACPDLADLLLASEGELPKRRQREVSAHLRECARCREELGNAGVAMRDVRVGGADTRVERLELFRDRLKEERATAARAARVPLRQWLPVAAAVPVLVAVMFFSNRYTTVVSAQELLTRAVAQEQSAPAGTVRRLQIDVKRRGFRTTRDVGAPGPRAVPIAETADDLELSRHLEASHLDPLDPLSVRGFRAWRDSLTTKTDSVKPVDADDVALRTETPDGILRSAELIVRRLDFQPVRATLHFEDFGDVEIVELTRWIAPSTVVATHPETPARTPVLEPVAPSVDTLNEAELDVRTALHAVGVDADPAIAVARSARVIEVRGRVDARQKTALARALHGVVPVKLLVHAGVDGSGVEPPKTASVPLQRWLDRTFGGGPRAQTFVADLTSQAALLQRRAAAFAALAARYPERETEKLTPSAQTKLDALVTVNYRDLVKAVEGLDDLLSLFLGTSSRHSIQTEPLRAWQTRAGELSARADRLERAVQDLVREEDIPLPTELGPGRSEAAPFSTLRTAVDQLWDELYPPPAS